MALATVSSTWGSAPRRRGSHMLMCDDGRFEGSVSGGCVEGEVLAAGAAVIADGLFRRLRYGIVDAAAWKVGLPCGGDIEIIVQPVGANGFAPEFFDRIRMARTAGTSLALITDSAGVTRERGSDQPSETDFVRVYTPPRRMLIIGAVQIAQSLALFSRELGMATTVIDPRSLFLTAERFPGVQLDDRWPDEAVAAAAPDSATTVVTLSHDIKIDDPALIAALGFPTGYIAALGSRKSHAARLERLAASGIAAGDLARIEGPAGLDIGAIGPAAIALSIAAGAVRFFDRP